jgi:hypothetical protein
LYVSNSSLWRQNKIKIMASAKKLHRASGIIAAGEKIFPHKFFASHYFLHAYKAELTQIVTTRFYKANIRCKKSGQKTITDGKQLYVLRNLQVEGMNGLEQ